MPNGAKVTTGSAKNWNLKVSVPCKFIRSPFERIIAIDKIENDVILLLCGGVRHFILPGEEEEKEEKVEDVEEDLEEEKEGKGEIEEEGE